MVFPVYGYFLAFYRHIFGYIDAFHNTIFVYGNANRTADPTVTIGHFCFLNGISAGCKVAKTYITALIHRLGLICGIQGKLGAGKSIAYFIQLFDGDAALVGLVYHCDGLMCVGFMQSNMLRFAASGQHISLRRRDFFYIVLAVGEILKGNGSVGSGKRIPYIIIGIVSKYISVGRLIIQLKFTALQQVIITVFIIGVLFEGE